MEQFFYNNTLAALRIRAFKRGSQPVTPPFSALQVLTLKHPRGHVVRLHRHLPQTRVTKILQECLVVIRGKIRIDLYTFRKQCVKRFVVRAGEAAVLFGMPHVVRYLEDSEIFEAKNGPFMDDKVFL